MGIMRILLIDECSKLVDANQVFLEINGHSCFSTTSLTTATSIMSNFVFDLIISEYDFSGKSTRVLNMKNGQIN